MYVVKHRHFPPSLQTISLPLFPISSFRLPDLGTHIDTKETGHIVEIQITLVALLAIKKGGGHAAYKLARLLELNAKVGVLCQRNVISSPARCRTTCPYFVLTDRKPPISRVVLMTIR